MRGSEDGGGGGTEEPAKGSVTERGDPGVVGEKGADGRGQVSQARATPHPEGWKQL